ncbi:MAG: ABC transporter permease [Terriglobia bacterium]
MDTLWQDFKFGLRLMLKSPGFTAVAVLTIALGIGVNTAMFSVVHGVLLQSLPFHNPDKIVMLWMRFTGIGIPKDRNAVSVPEFMDLRQHSKVFSHLAAINTDSFNISAGDRPEHIDGAAVSSSFFPLLGVQPILGRAFVADEETPGRDTVALISYGLWQRRFGSDPSLPGRTINVNGRSYQIIGVLPKGFTFPEETDLWTPLAFSPQDLSADQRGNHYLSVVARIRDAVSPETAMTDMEVVSQRIIEGAPNYPYQRFGFRVIMNPLLEEMVGDLRPALLILMGAVALVLLIACTNVANLLLAKASSREREMAIRTALGAGKGRLVRQLLAESIVLSLLGAVAGLVLAAWSLRVLTHQAESALPRIAQVHLNPPVLSFTMGVALVTGILFGLWPALQASSAFTHESLKEGGRSGTEGRGRHRLRGTLVVAEVTLSLVLLAGAGLLIRSFWRLEDVDPGFQAQNVLTLRLSLPEARYGDPVKIRNFYRELVRRVRELPGVQAAGAISALPLSGQGSSGTTTIDTEAVPPDRRTPEADMRPITPGFFQAMRIDLLRGRYFEEQDSETANPVAIIDESMASTFWPNEDPIGKRLHRGGGKSTAPWMAIVGVVRHVRFRTLESASRVQVYWPEAQNPWPNLSLAIRAGSNPRGLVSAIEHQVQAIDPEEPVYAVRMMDELLARSLAQRRLSMWLLSLFAGLALILAAVGIYGVISYSVEQRTRELGIRMALGAGRTQVLGMILGHSLRLILAGVVLGLAGSLALTRLMSGLLFNVTASDPSTFAIVAGILLAVGLVAGYLPAHRATLINPVGALRQE